MVREVDGSNIGMLPLQSADAWAPTSSAAPLIATPVAIHGNSLKTWPMDNFQVDRVQVSMMTDGRPLRADVELWQGPDYTPMKMRVYVEDGRARPFHAIIETPYNAPNTVAIRNTNAMEFPLTAYVEVDRAVTGNLGIASGKLVFQNTTVMQGGSVYSFAIRPEVERVQVLLQTDGRNLKARVELMEGPNNDKQIIEVYSSDGMSRPFYAIIATPGNSIGSVVRITNEHSMEFPFTASVGPA